MYPKYPRPKPRRVYVDEEQWRELKAHVAKEGTNISEWLRGIITKTIIISIFLLVAGCFLINKSKQERYSQNNFVIILQEVFNQ